MKFGMHIFSRFVLSLASLNSVCGRPEDVLPNTGIATVSSSQLAYVVKKTVIFSLF